MAKRPRQSGGNVVSYSRFVDAVRKRNRVRSGKIANKPRPPEPNSTAADSEINPPFEVGQFADHQRTVDGALKTLAVVTVLLKQGVAGMRILTADQIKRLLWTLSAIAEGACRPDDVLLAQCALAILAGQAPVDDGD
jgi:hypothetical protein